MTDVDVHLNIAMTPRVIRGALFLFFLAALPGELVSESVTLNSYYPAPSGIYTQMITTGNTFLARDGGYVGIGTSANIGGVGTMTAPTTTAGVNATKLIVLGGNVGIGTFSPTAAVQISDTRNAPAGVAVNGQIMTGDATNAGGVWLGGQAPAFPSLAVQPTFPYVGTWGSSLVLLTNGTAAGTLAIDNAGNVGIGVNPPQGRMDVNGIIVGRNADITFTLP